MILDDLTIDVVVLGIHKHIIWRLVLDRFSDQFSAPICYSFESCFGFRVGSILGSLWDLGSHVPHFRRVKCLMIFGSLFKLFFDIKMVASGGPEGRRAARPRQGLLLGYISPPFLVPFGIM